MSASLLAFKNVILTAGEAPSKATNQLALAAEEKDRGILQGSASWLSDGLKIEEAQWVQSKIFQMK